MIERETSTTSPKMRIVIVLIVIFLLASTFGLYASIVISAGSSSDTEATTEDETRFQTLYSAYSDFMSEQADAMSSQYFDTFVSYRSRIKAYNGADIDTLEYTDLVVGTGDAIESTEDDDGNVTYDTDYAAYYVGWLKDGTIFDSSFDDNDNPTSLNAPLDGSTNMIQGWLEGTDGMKIGGIREIEIPSTLGYGSTEQDSIPADSPLKFIIMMVDPIDETQFEDYEEFVELYYKLYGSES